jgi:hypothetical protein
VQRNRRVAAAIETAIGAVRSGGRLSPAPAGERALPNLLLELMTIGEESGQMESMLGKAAETFEARVEQKLKRLLTLLEPVLILGLGAVIAFAIVSILMAMLGLNELVAWTMRTSRVTTAIAKDCLNAHAAQLSSRRPATRPNSGSLFETRISFRATACAAMSVSSGPIGVPARSSFARTAA